MKWWLSFCLAVLASSSLGSAGGRKPIRAERHEFEGLHAFILEGPSTRIGQETVRLTPQEHFSKGFVPWISGQVTNTLKQQRFVDENPLYRLFLNPYLDIEYYNPLIRNTREEDRLVLRGLSKELELESGEIIRGFLHPDVFNMLVADHFHSRSPYPIPYHRLTPRDGCSSFILPGSRTSDGIGLFARSLEYNGVGRFDRYPSVYFIRKPGGVRYVLIGTSGMPTGGVTGMNEHGLALALHMVVSRNVRHDGSPILSLTTQILEEATSLEDALRLCNEARPATGWLLHLADVKDGQLRGARMEINPGKVECDLLIGDDHSTLTNHYLLPENAETQILFGPSIDHSSILRLLRLERLLADSEIAISPVQAASILGDRFDPELDRFMLSPPTGLSAISQVQAVILRPETREFWVSQGLAPAALRGRFLHFSLNEFQGKRDENKDFSVQTDALTRPEYTLFSIASLALYDRREPKLDIALSALNDILSHNPNESVYRLLKGLLFFKMKRSEEAYGTLSQLIADPQLDLHRRNVARLYAAKAADTLDQRDLAVEHYAELAMTTEIQTELKEEALRRLESPYRVGWMPYAAIELRYADLTGYEE